VRKINIQQIKSLDELKALAKENEVEGFINLYGGLRSSKTLYWTGKTWTVYNSIDGSVDNDLDDAQLSQLTNIPTAIKNGAFFIENY
jgi:hypothetical protein